MSFFKKHKKAILGTIGFHAVLLVLLLFLGFTTPLPLPEEKGILLDFSGGGSGVPDPGPSSSQQTSANQTNETNIVNEATNGNMTQDVEETATMNSSEQETTNETNENVTPQPDPEEQRQQEVADKLDETIGNGFNNASDSDAEGDGSGTPGYDGDGSSPGDGGDGEGSGSYKGNGWSLDGRSAEHIPKPTVKNCEGYVIVIIEVNRNGNVINAYAKPGGCTACDPQCMDKALNSARNARFNSDQNASIKQVGSITYRFTLN